METWCSHCRDLTTILCKRPPHNRKGFRATLNLKPFLFYSYMLCHHITKPNAMQWNLLTGHPLTSTLGQASSTRFLRTPYCVLGADSTTWHMTVGVGGQQSLFFWCVQLSLKWVINAFNILLTEHCFMLRLDSVGRNIWHAAFDFHASWMMTLIDVGDELTFLNSVLHSVKSFHFSVDGDYRATLTFISETVALIHLWQTSRLEFLLPATCQINLVLGQ